MSVKRKRTRKSGPSVFLRGLSAFFRKTGRGLSAGAKKLGSGLSTGFKKLGHGLAAAARWLWHGLTAFFGGVGRLLHKGRRPLALLLFIAVLGTVLVLTVSGGIRRVTRDRILSPVEAAAQAADEGFDCILILGAGLRDDGSPSHMLYDRVVTGTDLWLSDPDGFGALLMSGDHTGDYNEPAAMKTLAVSLGADDRRVFLDHEGYSTYESLIRARDVYGAKRVLIVTQEYHLYRALWIARSLGLDACGVTADKRSYTKETYREAREALARYKDYWKALPDDDEHADGTPVDLTGDGSRT
ncbi:MAG: YdcF family protein [Clostridia bacterium]|nr:YdcF family protein [Clostridia bacterium]